MKRMNSKEFATYIGVSKWKLDQLEKMNVITPMRDGRIRYYNEEQVEQYNEYLASSVEDNEKDNQIVVLLISESESFISSKLIEVLQYCNDNNIYVDKNLMYVIENNITNILKEIIEKISSGKLGRVIYSGDTFLDELIEKICDENMIQFDNLNINEPEKVDMLSLSSVDEKETFGAKLKRIIIGGNHDN